MVHKKFKKEEFLCFFKCFQLIIREYPNTRFSLVLSTVLEFLSIKCSIMHKIRFHFAFVPGAKYSKSSIMNLGG